MSSNLVQFENQVYDQLLFIIKFAGGVYCREMASKRYEIGPHEPSREDLRRISQLANS